MAAGKGGGLKRGNPAMGDEQNTLMRTVKKTHNN